MLSLSTLAGTATAEPSRGAFVAGGTLDDQGRTTVDLSAEIELDERFRVSGYLSRAEQGARVALGYGRLDLSDLRLAGGVLEDDWGLHLGYAPRLRWRPHALVEVRAGLDAAVGGGGLGTRHRLDAEGRLPDTLDLYAGAASLSLDLAVRPWSPLLLSVGVSGDVLAIGSPPRDERGPVETLLGDAARYTDVGISSALSEARAGAYGQVDLRLLGRGANRLTLSYREAWDWIHLDPLQPLLRAADAADLLPVDRVPLRATRSLALQWRRQGTGFAVRAGVEGRHVRDSTTALDFADRNGWSVGAWLAGEAGPLQGELRARYHFQPADLEPFLGEWPRYQVAGSLSARVAGDRSAGVRLETGAQLTLTDALGLPREGYAAFAQVRVWFGGERRARRSPVEDGALPHLLRSSAVALARRVAPDAPATAAAPELPATRAEATALAQAHREPLEAFLADLSTEERAGIVADGRALLAEGGGLNRETAERLLERRPQLAQRIDRFFPGLLGTVGLSGAGEDRGALVTGYGRAGLSFGAVGRIDRATRFAVTQRSDRIASDQGVTARAPDFLKAGPTELPSPFRRASLSAFVQTGRVDGYTVLVPRGRRYRVLAQVRSRWAHFLQRALTGLR